MIKPFTASIAAVLLVLQPGCADHAPGPSQLPPPSPARPPLAVSATNHEPAAPAVQPASPQPVRIIVKWRSAPQAPEVVALRTRMGLSSVQVFPRVGGGRMEVLLLPAGGNSAEVVKELVASGLVEFAEPDAPVKTMNDQR